VSVPASWLRRLYEHNGDFYMLINPGAIIMIESPDIQKRLTGAAQKETLLRLFLTTRDAERYRDRVECHEARITKTRLAGLWSLLSKIDSLSKSHYKLPVRVEVATVDADGDPRTIDTLHSTYELLS
jgi:hypothetical protein